MSFSTTILSGSHGVGIGSCRGRMVFFLFEDYFGYLEQFNRKNENKVFELLNLSVSDGSASLNAAAAKECKEKEEELGAIIAGHSGLTEIAQLDVQLNREIMEQALGFSNSDTSLTIPAGSIVPAACFMCITQEARWKILSVSNMKKAGHPFSVDVWRMKFEFGHKVRQAAIDILINYRGPYSEQVSAALLGMSREYDFACDLLDLGHYVEYRDEVSDISQEIRQCLLELLYIIRDTFPMQSAIDYDSIKHFRTARGNKHTEHLSAPRKEIVSANDVSSSNFDEIAFSKTSTPSPWRQHIVELESLCEDSTDVPTTPIPTKSAAPATPPSLSVNNYHFDQSSTNYGKRKSIGGSKDSEIPSAQPLEQRNDSVTVELGLQINNDGVAAPISGLPFGQLSDDESDEENSRNMKKSKNTREIQGS